MGDRTLGLAVSDPLGISAQGLGVLKRGKLSEDVARLLAVVGEYQVTEVVVGLPRALDGSIGLQARKVLDLVGLLEKQGVPVRLWDERYSSKAAERSLLEGKVRRRKRRAVIDKLAAVIILQNYLDSRKLGR